MQFVIKLQSGINQRLVVSGIKNIIMLWTDCINYTLSMLRIVPTVENQCL